MSHQDGMSNVGDRRAYEAQDQQHYDDSQINETGRVHGVNMAGYRTSRQELIPEQY
jgi:hypothetical protein